MSVKTLSAQNRLSNSAVNSSSDKQHPQHIHKISDSDMSRRSAVWLMAGAIATCLTCLSLSEPSANTGTVTSSASADHSKAVHWDYEGKKVRPVQQKNRRH